MNNHYIVSVGIATRNRVFYAEKVIRQVYSLSNEIQIVISDNSDDNSLHMRIQDIIDNSRCKYYFVDGRIAVVENYDNTAVHADGEYFICIGDDDIVLPNIIDLALWMRKNNIDAVRTSRNSAYRWPNDEETNGYLWMALFSDECSEFNPKDGVITILKQGCQGYVYTKMAGSYHALVLMERMHEVRKISGFYFSGFSPDIYSATCLSLLPGMKCVDVNYPISIPGSCPMSATAGAKKRTVVYSVEKAINNLGSKDYLWAEEIPYYYTPETTWAETVIKALKNMGEDELIHQYFNKKILVNIIVNRWTEYREEMYKFFSQSELDLIDDNIDIINPNIVQSQLTFLNRVKMHLYKDVIKSWNVNNSQVAAMKATKYLDSRRQKEKWDKILAKEI